MEIIGGNIYSSESVDDIYFRRNIGTLSSVSSTETDINTRLAKAWAAIDRVSVIWKSNLTDKIKRTFFPSSCRVDTAVWMHYMDDN